MLRSTLARMAALSLVALLAACAKQAPPPAPATAAYVPPPLPEPPAAPWCAHPAERTAFSVAALKSNMMVTAISCRVEDKYNSFVNRFRPSLLLQEKTADTYFSRNDKRRWQQSRDEYVTQLANAQTQRAMVLGDQFCARTVGEFDEVMALSKPEDLPTFAATKAQSVPQALKFTECTATPDKPAAPASTTATTTTTTKKKKK